MWPMYQYAPDHNAVLNAPAPPAAWARRLGGRINGGLAFSNGTLFVESFDGRVNALNARSGAVVWSTPLGGVVMTTPIVADGVVIAGTGTSQTLTESATYIAWGRPGGDAVVALSERTGRVLWRYPTVGEDMPSPALVRIGGRNAIVFANGDDHVRALDLRTGRLIWQWAVEGIATMSSAASDRGRVYVVIGGASHSKSGDRVIALDAQTGKAVWSAPYGNADCSPTVGGGQVFVQASASDSSRPARVNAFNDVAAIDEDRGALRWRWYSGYGTFNGIGSDEQAIAGMFQNGMLYQAVPATNEFIAFNARSGRVQWRLHTADAVKMSAVELNGRLYFGDTAGIFYTVDARSGRVISRRQYPSFFSVSSPVIAGSTLYVANDDVVRAIPLGTNTSASPSMQ